LVSHPSTQNSRCRGQHASLALGQQDDRPRSCCAPMPLRHASASTISRRQSREGRQGRKHAQEKVHRCVDADEKKLECEAPMRDQAETKLPPPTGSLFLRHSTLDEQCFPVVIKNVLGLLYTPSHTAYGADLVQRSIGIGIGK
jgi:hypothetical protein